MCDLGKLERAPGAPFIAYRGPCRRKQWNGTWARIDTQGRLEANQVLIPLPSTPHKMVPT